MTSLSDSASPESHRPSNSEQRIAALSVIEELNGLTHEELRWIADSGTERFVPDGELIFSLGAPPDHLIFILDGEIAIKRHTSSPVTVFTGRTGRITGKTPFSRIHAWNADGRTCGDVWLLEISEDQFPALLSAIPSMTERIVRVLIERNREYTRAEEQIGKLAALNKLAGNLAHELNNPASAARSAALALSQASELAKNDARYRLAAKLADQEDLDRYIAVMDALRLRIRSGSRADGPMFAGELEDTLSQWMQDQGFESGWKLAPILAEVKVAVPQLQEFLAPVPLEVRPVALQDLLQTLTQDSAIASVIQASERIFRLVAAVKDYSYMDRQPLQDIDIAGAFDSVLMMFQPRLKDVIINKNFVPGLPLLPGFGSELNQAFAALIENSLDAMKNRGTLTLSVKLQGTTFLIDVEDDGPGIPAECQDRVFEPFFTTKPFGGGLGLGLDTVQRVVAKHFGAVAFDTSAKGTIFHVRLPMDRVGIY